MKEVDNSFIDREFEDYLKQDRNNAHVYIKNRVIEQMKWYNKRSIQWRKRYTKLMTTIMILNSLIPVFTLSTSILGDLTQKILVTSISAAITAITAYIAMQNYKELWMQYRNNCEFLRSNLHNYFANAGEYTSADADENLRKLVQNCESFMLNGRKAWLSVVSSSKGNTPFES